MMPQIGEIWKYDIGAGYIAFYRIDNVTKEHVTHTLLWDNENGIPSRDKPTIWHIEKFRHSHTRYSSFKTKLMLLLT